MHHRIVAFNPIDPGALSMPTAAEATPRLTLDDLRRAVAGEGAALRWRTRLQPAGGPGDKVFPPTYLIDDKGARTKYAVETRRVGEQEVPVVLLDSVASQANRMEEALYAAWEEGRASFPVVGVDFTQVPDLADLGLITALHAPHRIADALLRDALTPEGLPFRDGAEGKAYTQSSVRNASAVYALCPTALVFGVWDSTGPRGGNGNKFPRALSAEVVGLGFVSGAKTGSRIDPVGIGSNVPVYHRADASSDWTTNVDEAQKDRQGKPVLFSRSGAEGKGKPSAINHSNVAPTVDTAAGGVTFDYALQTVVLSLPALRRLRFVHDAQGHPLPEAARAGAELAARTALAALGIVAVVLARERGLDLRSRALLVPEATGSDALEIVRSDGAEPVRYDVDTTEALALLDAAAKAAGAVGLGWQRTPLKLLPMPKLSGLIRESRRLAAAGTTGDDESQ